MVRGKKTKKQQIGDIGEKQALLYLKNKGFKILEKNFKAKGFEIDIIARKQNTIYFFEVKTSLFSGQNNLYKKILPLEHINKQKINSLYRGARHFLNQKNLNIEKVSWKIVFLEVVLSKDLQLLQVSFINLN